MPAEPGSSTGVVSIDTSHPEAGHASDRTTEPDDHAQRLLDVGESLRRALVAGRDAVPQHLVADRHAPGRTARGCRSIDSGPGRRGIRGAVGHGRRSSAVVS
jgi:hypothetical protein